VPKLSENSLKKRFQCDYCGETFRTRQGLSGHIQFKHQTLYIPIAKNTEITKVNDSDFIMSKHTGIMLWKEINRLPNSTKDAIVKLFVNWGEVKGFFDTLDVELTEQDFKTYLLTGLGKVFS